MTEPSVRLEPGDVAPDFTLPGADGEPVGLSAFRGRRVILYFYPAALTPGCIQEAGDFRDNLTDLTDAGYAVLGVSPDGPETLRRFRDKENLSFVLLSDPDRTTLAAYGAYGEKSLYGRTTIGVIRSTFVLTEDAHIALAYYNVKPAGHVAQLRKDLGI